MKDLGELQKRSTMPGAVGGGGCILREKTRRGGYQRLRTCCMDRITSRAERTGNEYERRYFREDLAAVRAHHDRGVRTEGMRA